MNKPYKVFHQTTKNQATAREKRFPTFATVNLPLWCQTKDHRQWQPPRLASHLLARLCAALQLEQTTQRWTVGLLGVSWTSWRTLRSSTQRDEVCCWKLTCPCHDTRRNRLCGHGGYCGYHAQVPRLKGRLYAYELLRKCEVSAIAARLRSGRLAGRGRSVW